MSIYSYCMFMYPHRASWHSSATLTEVFPCFSWVVRQMLGYNTQRLCTARTLPKCFVLFYVLFVLCRSVYYLFVNVYCTTVTWWQLNCSWTNISYLSFSIGVHTLAIESIVRHFDDRRQRLVRYITNVVCVKGLQGVSTLKTERNQVNQWHLYSKAM